MTVSIIRQAAMSRRGNKSQKGSFFQCATRCVVQPKSGSIDGRARSHGGDGGPLLPLFPLSVRIADEHGARTRSSTGRLRTIFVVLTNEISAAAVSDVIQAIDTHSHCKHTWLTKIDTFGVW